jgi:tetratricopeptide (TPR) repeat protein
LNLTESLHQKLSNPELTHDERARIRCQIAGELEHRGQHDAARDALADLWQGIGMRPALEGLTELTAAEVLLRAGTLSSWFASVHQLADAQDTAKDLISESISIFQLHGEPARAAAAQSDLAFCYWREGALDEARVVYLDALAQVPEEDTELRAKIAIRRSMVEISAGRYNDARRILSEVAPVADASENDALKGKFHNQLGLVLRRLSTTEGRQDYTDQAIIEYTAASHYFEQAGHTSYRARAENNIGYLLYTIGRYAQAHEHLNQARKMFIALRDRGGAAQVDETRARVLLAEERTGEALLTIQGAVRILEKGREQAQLAEALTTKGVIEASLGDHHASQSILYRAINIAERAGATEDAGRAALALIEQHAERLSPRKLSKLYERADELLAKSQDAETISRLRACAKRVVKLIRKYAEEQGEIKSWEGFSLTKAVLNYEANVIRQALRDAQGRVTRAAHLLGITHQGLAFILEGRQKELFGERTPPHPRVKSWKQKYGKGKVGKRS